MGIWFDRIGVLAWIVESVKPILERFDTGSTITGRMLFTISIQQSSVIRGSKRKMVSSGFIDRGVIPY
jgi:hypothetical protein